MARTIPVLYRTAGNNATIVTPLAAHPHGPSRNGPMLPQGEKMYKRTSLVFAALLAVSAGLITSSSANANRSIEVIGGTGVQAEGQLQFIGSEGNPALEVTCDVTLVRVWSAGRLPKIRGTQYGEVSNIRITRGGTTRSPACRHGSFLREVHDIVPLTGSGVQAIHRELGGGVLQYNVLPSLDWELIYDSFQGTLPRITGRNFHIHEVRFRFVLLEPFGATVECLTEGNAFGLIEVTVEGNIRRASAVRALTGLTTTGWELCPRLWSWSGSFNFRPTLTIRLL
jgi:hypothetical protein